MRNITVRVSDQAYHDARVWCAKRDTSVSRVVQTFLEDLPRVKHARRFPTPPCPGRSCPSCMDLTAKNSRSRLPGAPGLPVLETWD